MSPQPTTTAELLEQSLKRFSVLFSTLFPWLVLTCIGGVLLGLANEAGSLWALLLAVIGICVLLLSYVASARIISGVEKEPKDILANAGQSVKLFFPYIWIIILECFVFVGSAVLIIPLIIFSVFLAFAPYALVVENARGIGALTRSWQVVSGRWWSTLWRLLVLLFLIVVAMVIVGGFLGLILTPTALSAGIPAGGVAGSNGQPLGIVLVQQIIDAFLIMPVALCYLYEVYADLKRMNVATEVSAEKTARLWITVFLVIGIALAFVWIFVHGMQGGMVRMNGFGRMGY